jgi:membrane protein
MDKNKNKVKNRGNEAEKPKQIPFAGIKDIGKRVFSQINKDHVQIVSAGVGFYFFLALFPTIVAAISIYSLVLEPSQIQEQLSNLNRLLPQKAFEMINGFLEPILKEDKQKLGWGLLISILISLWSANKGTSALFEGINIAYNEESRGIIKKNALTLVFTLGAIVLGMLSLLIVIFFPIFIGKIGFSETIESVLGWGRWIVLGFILVFTLSMLYKIAPHRDNPEFKWVSWGAVIGAVLWVLGSALFSWYVNNFGSYSDLYGSFAAVVILLLWLFLTAFIVLLGAEINSEMEHQTRKDTTVGEDDPMGQRGGYHADHVAGKDKKNDE